MDKYLTLMREGSDEFTVKRSRFIGYAKPVTTQEEATEFINYVRTKHWDAKHNVYAYILRNGQQLRYSDDGEPQGTAGMPVLDVLQKEGLTDCCVVVTRYFGGILLGGGGLVRAYTHAAKLGVDAAGRGLMQLCVRAVCECDYGFYGKLSSLIPELGGTIENTDFGGNVRVEFMLPKCDFGSFSAKLTDCSFGKYSAKIIAELYSPTAE